LLPTNVIVEAAHHFLLFNTWRNADTLVVSDWFTMFLFKHDKKYNKDHLVFECAIGYQKDYIEERRAENPLGQMMVLVGRTIPVALNHSLST
jgi:hypothetical protein